MSHYPRPLRTTEDARAFFLVMGCTSFHMSREDPESYAQYQALKIPSELERRWSYELLQLLGEALERGGRDLHGSADPGWIHSQIVALAESLHEEEALVRACAASELMLECLRGRSRVSCAWSVLGSGRSRARANLPGCAADLGRSDLTRRLLAIADELLVEAPSAADDRQRWRRSRLRCAAIRKALGIPAGAAEERDE
ncbi:MAG: hypothetical protein JNM84_01535 [Planctomycetes bacterium]|nr:hypothetical protein [Planctomycetota bacterium]